MLRGVRGSASPAGARRSRRTALLHRWSGLLTRPSAPSKVLGGVEVAAGREVAALDEPVRGDAQVVTGAAVAAGRGCAPRPSGRGRSPPGGRARRRTPPAPAPRARHRRRRRAPATMTAAVTSGRSTRVTRARSSSACSRWRRPARSEAPIPSSQSSATTTSRARAGDQRGGLLGCRADDDHHAVAAALEHPRHSRLDQRGATVGEPHQGLGSAHPPPGPGGEDEPDGAHPAARPTAASTRTRADWAARTAASGSASSAPLARPPSSRRVSERARPRGSGAPASAASPVTHVEDRVLVGDRAGVDRRAGRGLGGGVEERAAPVAVAPAGGAEGVEQADQLVGRLGPGGGGGVVQLAAPDAVDPVEVGEHEVVLRREPLVEGRLGHARLGDDPVDPDGPDAVGVEEPERGVEDALAGGGGHGVDRRQICLLASIRHRQTCLCQPLSDPGRSHEHRRPRHRRRRPRDRRPAPRARPHRRRRHPRPPGDPRPHRARRHGQPTLRGVARGARRRGACRPTRRPRPAPSSSSTRPRARSPWRSCASPAPSTWPASRWSTSRTRSTSPRASRPRCSSRTPTRSASRCSASSRTPRSSRRSTR